MTADKYPFISAGTFVKTTQPNLALHNEWADRGRSSRQWGIEGKVIAYHGSHGLYYEVRHPDGTVGSYDPSELVVVIQPQKNRVCAVHGSIEHMQSITGVCPGCRKP